MYILRGVSNSPRKWLKRPTMGLLSPKFFSGEKPLSNRPKKQNLHIFKFKNTGDGCNSVQPSKVGLLKISLFGPKKCIISVFKNQNSYGLTLFWVHFANLKWWKNTLGNRYCNSALLRGKLVKCKISFECILKIRIIFTKIDDLELHIRDQKLENSKKNQNIQ